MRDGKRADEGKERTYYIFVCSEGRDVNDRIVHGLEVASSRLGERRWPIYKRTPFRDAIRVGDSALIYVAGYGKASQSFIGQAQIGKVIEGDGRWREPIDEMLSEPAIKVLGLEHVVIWKDPVRIHDCLPWLDFVKNKRAWGCYLMSGVRKIGKVDFFRICQFRER